MGGFNQCASPNRITWVVFDETTDTIIKRVPLVGLQLLITQRWCLATFEAILLKGKNFKTIEFAVGKQMLNVFK